MLGSRRCHDVDVGSKSLTQLATDTSATFVITGNKGQHPGKAVLRI